MSEIFVDLDECLICSLNDEDETYVVRPGAHQLLQELRLLAPTNILTAGNRCHAINRNRYHDLGFRLDQLFGQEDFYSMGFTGGWSQGKSMIIHNRRKMANAILIDNEPAEHPNAQAKMEHLGITQERLINVPHFGNHENDNFHLLIPTIIEKVKKLLHP